MSDIVERLRNAEPAFFEPSLQFNRKLNECIEEAADEIERLRAENTAIRHTDVRAYAERKTLEDNIALRARVATLENDLADALDVKSGLGPTALGSVMAERDGLRARVTGLDEIRRALGPYALVPPDGGAEPTADLVRNLVTRIAELEAAQEWRPIESAPRDGVTAVDLWFPQSGRRTNWRWYSKRAYWGSVEQDRFSRIMTCDESPTHWLPLPAPPKVAT